MDKKQKRPNVVLYTIFMIILFFVATELGIWGYGANLIYDSVTMYPKGELVISEVILSSLVLILMLLFKNSYVFTQPHKKFSKGLFYGLFYIVGASFILLISAIRLIDKINDINILMTILNLLIGCFFIGVAEEFLCRGWLLNEFLERYGDTKKGVWYSIIISGVIFGLMHIGNIANGQDVANTISQIIGAAGTGILFGLIYYKTKNIWSVIFLHAFWDFSIYLNEIIPTTSATEITTQISVASLIFSVLTFAIEVSNIIPHIKKIDDEPKKSSIVLFSVISFIFYFNIMNITGIINTQIGTEYNYDSIEIKNYSFTNNYYEDYIIKNNNYSFNVSLNDNNNLVFTNQNTNYSVEIECESLYDYIVMEEKDYFVLAYVDYTDSANPFLKYNYIYKKDLTNDNSFVDGIKNNYKKFLLKDNSKLVIIHDRDKNISYIDAVSQDYGNYLLVAEDKVSILKQ